MPWISHEKNVMDNCNELFVIFKYFIKFSVNNFKPSSILMQNTELQIADCRLQIADCRLQIAEGQIQLLDRYIH